MGEPRFVAHLGAAYVNGRPVGTSVIRLLRRLWNDPRDISEQWAEHRARMRRLHAAYGRRRR